MKVIFALFFDQGFFKNGINIGKKLFMILGGTFTVYQILNTFANFTMDGYTFVYLFLAFCIIAFLWALLEANSKLKKTFHLKDHYKITVDVNDYIVNAKKYPEAHLVSGSNNEFNIDYAREGTLQRELVLEYFGDGANDKEESKVLQEDEKGIRYDENHHDRLYNYAELLDSLKYKTDNYKDFNLTLLKQGEEGERYFTYGSIISEKCKTRRLKYSNINWINKINLFLHRFSNGLKALFFRNKRNVSKTRRIVFFANSQYTGGEYKGNKSTLNSIHMIWDHFLDQDIQVNALLMPLLGTGLSFDATPMSSTIAIIDHFFELSYPENEEQLKYSHLVPHLIISIHPENIINGEIDLLAVHKHIEVKNNSLNYAYRKSTIYHKIIDDNNEANRITEVSNMK